jgi:very-short-patch-repair endonuclease
MRKTLSVRPLEERTDPPQLQKRGRGWNIAESRLDTLHETAREMRREPTAAQAKLHEALVAANLGKYRFKRQTVIGSAIVDFACQPLKVVVEIDEEGANPELDRRRDRSLAEVGIKVLRYPATEVLADPEAIAAGIVAELKARWHEQRANSKPRGGYKGDRYKGDRGHQR